MFKMIGYFITENLNFYFMFGLNKIIDNLHIRGFFFYMKYFLLLLIYSMCGERERLHQESDNEKCVIDTIDRN